MDSTGIVRRFDDLGRIVIPREIRIRMNITEDDSMEIFFIDNNTICLKKYYPNGVYEDSINSLIKGLDNNNFKNTKEIKSKLKEILEMIKTD